MKTTSSKTYIYEIFMSAFFIEKKGILIIQAYKKIKV